MEAVTTRGAARAGTGRVLSAVVLLLPFGGCGLARTGAVPEGAPIVLGMLSVLVCAVLVPALCEERAASRYAAARLTARTLTGARSVDLDRIATVRLLTTFSYGSVFRTLLVRDDHGVWLGVTTGRSRGHVRRAVQRAAAKTVPGAPGPRVSRAARVHLGLAPERGLVGHTVLAFLLLTVSVSLYVAVLLRLGGQ
ncbi:hypothetical protein [Streptomyces sp. JW3]|uniref:hypothetical protein n=1 Tax=Streptomyces sp. JW3 TaxID=3456955 RepID=UPI003FA40A12